MTNRSDECVPYNELFSQCKLLIKCNNALEIRIYELTKLLLESVREKNQREVSTKGLIDTFEVTIKTRNQVFEREVKSNQEENRQLKNLVSQLASKLDMAEKSINKLDHQKHVLESCISQNELENEAKLKFAENCVQTYAKENRQLKEEISKIKQINADHEAQLKRARGLELTFQQMGRENSIQQLIEENRQLKKQISEFEVEKEKIFQYVKEKIAKMGMENERKMESAENLIHTLTEENNRFNEQIRSTENSIQKLVEENCEFKETVSKIDNENRKLEERMTEIRMEHVEQMEFAGGVISHVTMKNNELKEIIKEMEAGKLNYKFGDENTHV